MKRYTKGDVQKAYRVSDGAEVEVPKAWLSDKGPYAGAYTRQAPAEAKADAKS